MNSWNCDICGKQTFLNAKHEHIMEQNGVRPEPVLDEKTGQPLVKINKLTGKHKMVTKEVPLMKHVFRKMYRQNVATGKVEAVDVPAVKYLQEPCVIIKLKCGDENFQRDFCQSCLDEYVGDEVKALRKKLMELKGK